MADSNSEKHFSSVPSTEELMALYEEQYREQQKDNPESIHYQRKNERPRLHIFRVLLFVLITMSLVTALSVTVNAIFHSSLISVLCGTFLLLLMIFIHLKHIVIWLVMAYQRFAPEHVRNRCRYEPSCSNYMILAIHKYGFWKGFAKGFKRWTHCKPPYGGHDEP